MFLEISGNAIVLLHNVIMTHFMNCKSSPCNVFSSFFLLFLKKKIPIVVRDVCPPVRLSSVEMNFFGGNLISNRPIDLKIGVNVR